MSYAPDMFRYDVVTRYLHWLTFLLVVVLWTSGQTTDLFPADAGRAAARSVHIVLGVVLSGAIVFRLMWRRTSWGRRQPVREGLGDLAAQAMHIGLVVLLTATVAFGLVNVVVRGEAVFTWVKVPALTPGWSALRQGVGEVHEWCANLLLAVAGLHAAAALVHRFVLHDRVLRRMMWCRTKTCRAAAAGGHRRAAV